MSPEDALRTCIARATRRRRARYGLEGLVVGAALGIGAAALASAWGRASGAPPHAALVASVAVGGALAGALASALRRVHAVETAGAIDAHHRLHSAIATGLELSWRAPRSPFERLALDDGGRAALDVDPVAPFPFTRPRALGPLGAAAAALALSLAIPERRPQATAPAATDGPEEARTVRLEPEIASAMRDALGEVARADAADEVKALTGELERLLGELAEGSVDPADALARVARVVRDLEGRGELELRRLESQLEEVGDALGRGGPLLEEVSATLRDGRPGAASEPLRAIASALDRARVVSAREKLAMKEALERASSPGAELERAERARREAEERLLERERRGEPPSLLERERRDLDALKREEESLREDRRRLERLRRELDEAASALDGGRDGEAGESMRRAAEALEGLESFARSARDMEALRRLAEQLRDSIRESGASGPGGEGGGGGGRGRGERLQRFSLRASGEGGQTARLRLPDDARRASESGSRGSEGGRHGTGEGSGGAAEGSGAEEEAVDGASRGEGRGPAGDRRDPAGDRRDPAGDRRDPAGDRRDPAGDRRDPAGDRRDPAGDRRDPAGDRRDPPEGSSGSQAGSGTGTGESTGGAGEILELTPAGEGGPEATAELEIPRFGPAPDRGGRGGDGAGAGAGEAREGAPLADVGHDESHVEGVAGEGPTRSQLILGAADRGFSRRGYQKVHADYSAHAEEALEDEAIPPGYRFYVRRYFQLIRPRDGQSGEDER